MPNVFLCGHGQWKTRGEGTIFTTVPGDTTLRVYTPVGRFLGVADALAIIRGAAGALPADQIFRAYQSCPDTSLFPALEFEGYFRAAVQDAGGQLHVVAHETRLSYLLAQYAGNDVYWIACRGHNLRRQLAVENLFPRQAWRG
jgi:hypothetical protein